MDSKKRRRRCELSRNKTKVLHMCREIHEHETKPSTDKT